MAGKPKPMSQIKQLLKMHKQGNKHRTIARNLGISKNTVKSYLKKAGALSQSTAQLLKLEDPELEALFHAGSPAYKDERYQHLKDRLGYYALELQKTGVTRLLLWQEYKETTAKPYGKTQFCYHLSQYLSAKKPSMVLHHKPAEKLFVDFTGKTICYTDPKTGELISCQVFVACLPYSDYGFAIAVPSQSSQDFLYALRRCLEHLGGAPQALVSDNLKSAVDKADRYEPDINRSMEDFANHYGCTVVPARAYKPKDKALVENQVKLVYQRVFAKLRDQVFFSLDELNSAIATKVEQHNQTRMQQKPWCRQERFLADEKNKLEPLPQQPYEQKYYCSLKVAQNNHIYLGRDKHYYSVPYQHIGQQAKVIYTRNTVDIYLGQKLIATHLRNSRQGGYSTCKEHLCPAHKHHLARSPQYYLDRAMERSQELHRLFTLMFGRPGRYAEQLYKSCDGLLRLCRTSDKAAFESACRMAIDNEVFTYRFISNILTNKTAGQQNNAPQKALPGHGNIRGKEYYTEQQLTLNI